MRIKRLTPPGLLGYLDRVEDFPSQYVPPRHVDIWLPSAYTEDPLRRFPVLYMQDGQNLFVPSWAFMGVDWGIDEALEALYREARLLPPIVVGIWNTPHRVAEYMPTRPFALAPKYQERFRARYGQAPASDAYLQFMVEELKPFVDRHYRTLPDVQHTFLMGSSMGALLSLYALCEYPDIFGGAACLSTSWTIGGRLFTLYLRMMLPGAGLHRLYFDYGMEARLGRYESFQRQVNQLLLRRGYRKDEDWTTRRFPGADHSEAAWRSRVEIPLRFLLDPADEG